MMRAPVEAAEVRCTEAEETADELDKWVDASDGGAAQDEGSALAGMLRALAKSLRLACVAGASDADRADLMDEVESTLTMALALIQRGSTLQTSRDALRTMPPPPGYDPKAAFGEPHSTREVVAKIKLLRIAKQGGS
jgi:hypothetical protein